MKIYEPITVTKCQSCGPFPSPRIVDSHHHKRLKRKPNILPGPWYIHLQMTTSMIRFVHVGHTVYKRVENVKMQIDNYVITDCLSYVYIRYSVVIYFSGHLNLWIVCCLQFKIEFHPCAMGH